MTPGLPYALPGAQTPFRWNRHSDYFRYHYGERVQKIPLDAGFSCPNRDGRLSSSGCIFCNPLGSGTGLGIQGLDIAAQWDYRCEKLLEQGYRLFMAYLQSFSNTYGPIERLAEVLEELQPLPGIIGLAVGTRPDCVDNDKLALIAETSARQNWRECWVEFGIQSRNNATLARINRGHSIERAEEAIAAAARHGLKVCVHLIAGLPGEDERDFIETVRWASAMPIQAVKFHCLYVCRGTTLARMLKNGEYHPWHQEEYARAIVLGLPWLRPDIVVQRITGQPGKDELLAPDWMDRVTETTAMIASELARNDTWQGKNCPQPEQAGFIKP